MSYDFFSASLTVF